MTTLVIDTSAVIATLFGEASAPALIDQLDQADELLISAATVVEVGIVLEARLGPVGASVAERFIRDAAIDVISFDRSQADRAMDGWRRFGKGRHSAALNLGDCFTYALASTTGHPVLCVGDDFPATDLDTVALGP